MSRFSSHNSIKSGFVVFVLLVVFVQIGFMVVSAGVATEQIYLTTSDGARLNAEVYKPASSSVNMPGIVICHGFLASHQTMQSLSLEFAKRGFMVVAVDLDGHGDSEGSVDLSVDGAMQNALSFWRNPPGDGISVPSSSGDELSNFSAFTFEAWVKADTFDDQAAIFCKSHDVFQTPPYTMYSLSLGLSGDSNTYVSVTSGDTRKQCFSSKNSINAGSWCYVVGTWNGEYLQNYVNGVTSGDPCPKSGPIGENNEPLEIGYWTGGWLGKYDLNGEIDEVRISNVSRSASWIKASYESERDNLVSFGSEEFYTQESPGWLSGWEKRVKITIDHNEVDSTLSGFPILVHLGSLSGKNGENTTFIFDEVGNDSKKIAVTEGDGKTECCAEIERWDGVSKNAWLWVKVPSINASEDTNLYLYYDKGHGDNAAYVGNTDSFPAENVWDSNFKLVLHMHDDSDVSHVGDSTSNHNVGTKIRANGPSEVDGEIGKAERFSVPWRSSLQDLSMVSLLNESKVELAVRAAVDYLTKRVDVDHEKIALLGHSMGGGAVFVEGYSDPRVKSVVAIAPASFFIPNSSELSVFPSNLLLVAGGRDDIVNAANVVELFGKTTDGGKEIGKTYGNFSQGNARKMIVSPQADHAGEVFDSFIQEEAVSWVQSSLGIEAGTPVSISPLPTILLALSMIMSLFSVFPAIVSVKALERVTKGGNVLRKSGITRLRVGKLVFLYFIAWGCSGLLAGLTIIRLPYVPDIPFLSIFSWIPVVFANLFVYAYLVASILFLFFIFVFRRRTEGKNGIGFPDLKMRNAIFGASGFLIMFSSMNFAFTQILLDLLPTAREIVLMAVLFFVFLPLAFLEELWLRNVQTQLPAKSLKRIIIPTILCVFPEMILLTFASIFLGYLVLLALVLQFASSLFTTWLFDETGDVVGGTIFNTFFIAWIIAVILPFGTFQWPSYILLPL
jgi:dienelactone hydrolase